MCVCVCGGGGSLRDLSKNILKQGWVKAKVVRRAEGVLKVSPPLPPPPRKILIIHEVATVIFQTRGHKKLET